MPIFVERVQEWGRPGLAEGQQLGERELVEVGVESWFVRRAGAFAHGCSALFGLRFVAAASVGAAERSRCSFRSPCPSLGTQAGQT